jgi:hypothetical protein
MKDSKPSVYSNYLVGNNWKPFLVSEIVCQAPNAIFATCTGFYLRFFIQVSKQFSSSETMEEGLKSFVLTEIIIGLIKK